MSGHLQTDSIDPSVPASFSDKVLVDLLRTKMGFTGVVVTDALNMAPPQRWAPAEAAVRALLAGNDLLLMPPDVGEARQGLLDALASGRIPRQRLIDSVTRIAVLKLRLGGYAHPAGAALNSAAAQGAAEAVAAAAVTVLRGHCGGALVTGPVRVTTAPGRDQQAAWLRDALADLGVPVQSGGNGGGTQVHLVGYGDTAADLDTDAAVTVGMDTPYLLAQASSPIRVATYSSSQASMRALAAVLAGRAGAPGRSPVAVPGLPRTAC